MRNFRSPSKFKNEMMNIFINQLNEHEIHDFNEVFRRFDKDGHGMISIDDLREAIKQVGVKLDSTEVDKIFQLISEDNQKDKKEQKNIKYTEFIKAILNQKLFMKEERLWNLFKYFDQDNTNQITQSNLNEIFRRHGKQFQESEIKNMIQEVDPNKDGKITFDEFKQIMFAGDDGLIQNTISDFSSNRNREVSQDKKG